MDKKERDEADEYAGPDKSFPLYADGAHLKAAWDLAGHAADPAAVRSRILAFAHKHGLTGHLPINARPHEVKKAFVQVEKAWTEDGDTFIEGWVAPYDPNGVDLDKHRYPPEVFRDALPEYFARNAPLSDTHDFKPHPKGHQQRGALLRDGQVLLDVAHPTDPAPFRNLPASGSGWYGRARITDQTTSGQIQKGNMAGFSWTGIVDDFKELPGGVIEYNHVGTVRETCVAAYPRNTRAIFQVSKAETQNGPDGSTLTFVSREELERQNKELDKEQLEALLAGAIEQIDAKRAKEVQKAVDMGELTAMKAENATLKTQVEALTGSVEALRLEVQKAAIPARGDGVGTKQIIKSNDELLEDDPATYIVQKAQKPEELGPREKDLIAAITLKYMRENMQYAPGEK